MARKTIQYKGHSFDISYEIVNPKGKVDAIILHGWGSNKTLMRQAFGDKLKGFRHIYIDLPGFGHSTDPMVMDSGDYARVVELLLIELNAQKDVALGHSFGGKVATLLEPDLLVLLSSAGIVLPKPLEVRAKIALYKMLKMFGLTRFREYFVANDAKQLSKQMYETFKTVVNEDFTPIFADFPNKALLCWGESDTATPLIAGKTIEMLIKNSKLVKFEGDHYFFMHHAEAVAEEIENAYLELLKGK